MSEHETGQGNGMRAAETTAVEAIGVHKRFGSTRALRGVDLRLRPGRCLGLVGRNGAGKSTLVSILSGVRAPDEGEVRFGGEPAPPLGAAGAWRERIATVYQHSMVVPQLTVAENVFLGRIPHRAGRVDWRRMRDETDRTMREWGFDIDANTPCSRLTVEQRQIVEIARALSGGARCLLLDEPTAALERGAIRRLFSRVRQLTENGVAVLYISHHLEEVFEICHDVTVLRDGAHVLDAPVGDLTQDQLVSAMVGERVSQAAAPTRRERGGPAARRPAGSVRLVVDNLSTDAPRGALHDVSLTIGAGERVGVTGLLGAGVSTLARVVAGATPYAIGTVTVDGRTLRSGRRDLALRAGVGYIPEDRHAEGFVPQLGVAENVTMSLLDRLGGALGLLTPRRRESAAAPLVGTLSVVASGARQPVGELSGGNQQKVTVARALARDPALIVAITPTRGVDVASKSLLLGALADATDRTGAGLLLASDELDDLVICDRVIVLVRGEVFTEFTAAAAAGEPPFDREALIAATEGLTRNVA